MHPCVKHQGVQRPFTHCSTAATRKPRLSIRARTSDHDRLKGIEDSLASEFSAHINELCLKAPLQHRRPSPLDPPTAAVAAQLDALQINDWPEPDAGVYTAMAFAKPYDCEQLPAVTAQQHTSNLQHPQQQRQRSGTSGQPPGILRPQDNPAAGESESENDNESDVKSDPGQIRVRSWAAREQWLTPDEFVEHLHSAPYDVLLGCDSWRACSSMVFPATRAGQRAVQAVEVLATPRQPILGNVDSTGSALNGSSTSSSSSSGSRDASVVAALQKYTFTFCLELIGLGPYKGCWMTVGVRPGNYSV